MSDTTTGAQISLLHYHLEIRDKDERLIRTVVWTEKTGEQVRDYPTLAVRLSGVPEESH